MSFFNIFSRKQRLHTSPKNAAQPVSPLPIDVPSDQYQSDAPYILPPNTEDISRLDFQHYILRAILQRNYLAPVVHPTSILDVGCGTGRWALEMAQTFPRASVVGFDLILPEQNNSTLVFPDSCHFVQGNVLDSLPFADHSFDFVHQRLLVFALPADSWVSEVRELARVTRPGGWIELVEVDIAFENMGPASTQLATWATAVSKKRGIDPSMARQVGTVLRSAGFDHVVLEQKKNPIGDWGGRIGNMAATGVQAVNRAMSQSVIAQLAITPVQYDQVLAEAVDEYNQYRSFSYSYVAYGQRAAK